MATDEALERLDEAYEVGIRVLDTANSRTPRDAPDESRVQEWKQGWRSSLAPQSTGFARDGGRCVECERDARNRTLRGWNGL